MGPILCDGGSGGTPPENFEILHALKCVLRASQVPFCACIQYIPTCQLPSLFRGFTSKTTTYGALARRGHVRLKKQADLKSSETNLLKKLDWDVNDEQDLILKEFSTVWGPPHTGGPGQTAPVAPPPVGGTVCSSHEIA